jgi:hypothetical protein
MKVWVSYSDFSNFVVGYAWQLICQVGPWPLYESSNKLFDFFHVLLWVVMDQACPWPLLQIFFYELQIILTWK